MGRWNIQVQRRQTLLVIKILKSEKLSAIRLLEPREGSHLSKVGHLTVIGEIAKHVHRKAHCEHVVTSLEARIDIPARAALLLSIRLLLLLPLLSSEGGGGVVRTEVSSIGLSINGE